MSVYIKWGGLLLLLWASTIAVKEYRGYVARRISEQESIISMLCHLEGRISRYLTPLGEALRDFDDENLRRAGFYEAISDAESPASAFKKILPRLSVGENTRTVAAATVSALSEGYRDEVVVKIREGKDELEKVLAVEREKLSKNEKVASALLPSISLGIFILLV